MIGLVLLAVAFASLLVILLSKNEHVQDLFLRVTIGAALGMLVLGLYQLAARLFTAEEPDLQRVLRTRSASWNLWYKDMVICTATTIQGGRVLSAGHCVEFNPKGLYQISQSGSGKPDVLVRLSLERWKFRGIMEWRQGDYAVFRHQGGAAVPLSLPTCKARPKVGETVYAWPAYYGMHPVLRVGVYSGELHFSEAEAEAALGGMGFVQMPGGPGGSGTGMLRVEDRTVCVWGIAVGSFYRPSDIIVSWLP
ncbi:MAG: hypothetical protein C4292_02530 [Nitrososphaera sp.]